MWYFLEDDSRFKAGDVMFGDATKGSGDTLRVKGYRGHAGENR